MNHIIDDQELLTKPMYLSFKKTNDLRRAINIIQSHYGSIFQHSDLKDRFKRKIYHLQMNGASFFHNGDNALAFQMESFPNGERIGNDFTMNVMIRLPFKVVQIKSILE